MKENSSKNNVCSAVKIREVKNAKEKYIDLVAFTEMSEYQRIEDIHKHSEIYWARYKKVKNILFDSLSNGLKTAIPTDAVKSSNISGHSDITANVAIKRTYLMSDFNVELVYGFGIDVYVDSVIILERALRMYMNIISLYDEKTTAILLMRLEGNPYEMMEMKTNYTIPTLRQYVYRSKESLKDKFDEVIRIDEAKRALKEKRE